MTFSSALWKFRARSKSKWVYELKAMHRSIYTKLKIKKKFWKSPYFAKK